MRLSDNYKILVVLHYFSLHVLGFMSCPGKLELGKLELVCHEHGSTGHCDLKHLNAFKNPGPTFKLLAISS
jgi:hypothetical protein